MLKTRIGAHLAPVPNQGFHLTAAPVGSWVAQVTLAQPQVKLAVRPERLVGQGSQRAARRQGQVRGG